MEALCLNQSETGGQWEVKSQCQEERNDLYIFGRGLAFIPEEKGKLWSVMEKSDLFPLNGLETRMVQPCLRVVRNTKILCSEVQCDRISGSFGQRMYEAE